LGWITQQEIDFGWAVVSLIIAHVLLEIQIKISKYLFAKLFHRMSLASSDNIVVWVVLLKHQPHSLDILFSVSPVSARIKVTQIKLVLKTHLDPGSSTSNLTSHKRFSTTWGLMI